MSTPEGGSPTSELAPTTPVKAKGRVTHDSRRQSIAVDVAMRLNELRLAANGYRLSVALVLLGWSIAPTAARGAHTGSTLNGKNKIWRQTP